MNITLELLNGIALVKNKGTIPITSDPFTVSVLSRNYVRDNLFLTATLNGHTESFELVDEIAVLPPSFVKAGELKFTIRKIINGEVLKIWESESVYLKELDGTHEAIPQITALTSKVEALTAAVAELKEIIIENGEF